MHLPETNVLALSYCLCAFMWQLGTSVDRFVSAELLSDLFEKSS